MKEQWQGSARVQARMRELGIPDTAALQGYFTARLGDYLRTHGRQLVGWDEILQGGAPPGAVVVSWRGVQGAVAAAAAGHEAVLAPDPVLYFDNRQGSSAREPPGRGRVVTLRDVYEAAALPEAVGAGREHLLGLQGNLWTEHVRTEERAAYMTYPRAAALAEIAWSQPGLLSWANFRSGLPSLFARYRALGIPYSADVLGQPPGPLATQRHMSQDLRTCSDQLVLSLEDDAPLHGPRAVFLIDVMNPCWVFPGVDLSHPARLTAAVGQVPFNFQLGHQVESIKLTPPATPSGELEVHVDGCEGAPAAVLSLGPALHNDAVTRLPATRLPVLPGQHDLCFRFTQARLDPLWALDWVQVSP
jgi:hexosaminidase